MVRVMYFEDMPATASQIKGMLRVHDIFCDTTSSWTDVHGWIFDSPGENVYDAFIFDLKAAGSDMPTIKNVKTYSNINYLCPTHYYISEVLCVKKSYLLKRTILFSAYLDLGKLLVTKYNIPFISKNNNKSDLQLISKIMEIKNLRNQ